MNKKDDVGSAFPRAANGSLAEGRIGGNYDIRMEFAGGMSLRDWFAGQALNGLLASGTVRDASYIAKRTYEFADAMLAERNK